MPSFRPVWERWRADQDEYVARFPEEAPSNAELSHEFLARLASHLGKRVSAGEAYEVGWMFASLEPILAAADQEGWNALTVGFLESLIYAVEREGADAAPLGALATGPEASLAWQAAYEYIHPPADQPSSPREV